MRGRESTPAREKTTERGFFNWCIITWPPCVERMGSRRRSERIGLQSLNNPSYEMLSLQSHLPRFCIIYSRCSAYDVPERTERDREQQHPLPFCATYSVLGVRKISPFLLQLLPPRWVSPEWGVCAWGS